MPLSHTPLLQIQRDLYNLPCGWIRFERYLERMIDSTQEMVLPLAILNPMGKAHVAQSLDRLLELNAESIAAEAVEEAVERLKPISEAFRHTLVVADDAQGGWTDRYLTDMSHRFDSRTNAERSWIVTLIWTSEEVTHECLSQAVLAQVYRTLYQQRFGLPKTLKEHMRQEGLALAFAQAEQWLDDDDLEYSLSVIAPYIRTTELPVIFGCLYGDEAAAQAGYPALGLSKWAGFAVSLQQAQAHASGTALCK